MTPNFRKLSLTAHVSCSVGWFGALAGFLALSISALASQDMERIRSSYTSMDLLGRFVLVPLSFAALATGIFQALGTEWGLVRHYWVLAKLVLTLFATFALIIHQFTAVSNAAAIAATAGPGSPELKAFGIQLVANAAGGLLILIAVTALSIFKPWGMTLFSWCRSGNGASTEATALPNGLRILLMIVAILAAVFALIHLAGGGLSHAHHR